MFESIEQMDTDTILPAGLAVLDIPYFTEEGDTSNLDEIMAAKEWALYRATLLFEDLPPDASRATFICTLRAAFPALAPRRAERIVDKVTRSRSAKPQPQRGPHPTNVFELVTFPPSADDARLRRLALNMYLEKRAARPKHDPIPAADAPALARAENEARLEARRTTAGMPSGLLRTVDYEPGAKHVAPTWLVKGLLPNRGLGLLIGESQAGKSFLAIHAAVCVARGLPFFGKKTKPGAVLYIAAEGGSGVLPRIQAADEAMGGTMPANHLLRAGAAPLARAPIKVVVETPNLSRDGDPAALARTLRAAARDISEAGYTLALVLVDTWHASLGGADEQAAADAGHALKPFREAVEELGVFTLIVHHPGKDLERGARGSSALRAAVDTELEIRVPGFDGPKAKPAAIARRVTLTKQRDGAVGEDFHFRLNTVQLGRDDDGDPWTTCTVLPCDAPAGDGVKPKGKHDARLDRALTSSLAEHGGERVPMRMVRGYFNNAGPADEADGACRMAWSRALKNAREAGLIETDSCDEWIWSSNLPASEASQRHTP